MKILFRQKLFLALFSILSLTLLLSPAQAATKAKSKAAQKERLVLLPMDISAESRAMYGQQESAVVEGLAQKYEVFSGERVMQELRKAASKESSRAKGNCDETRCLEDVAIALQTENVAMVHVTKTEGGYLLSISIKNVMTNQAVFDKSLPCEGCSVFKVIDKLKELGGAQAAVAIAPVAEAPQPKVNQNDPDAVLWVEAQKGNSADDYQVYIDTYPKGKYLPFAKARIKKLKDEAQALAEQQEQNAWDTAQQSSSEDTYTQYLKGYPQGRFAGLAKVRLDKLKNDVAAREETSIWNKADSSNDQAAIENYLNRYPSGRYIAAANAKLKAIKEEAAKGPAMVRIPGKNYEIGKYDVTQKEWQAVMGNNPSQFTACGENCPVEKVSWNDIQEFLQKLNAKTGRQYRLPNEEEWEYACYGGNKTEYCGSNDINSVAWYSENSNNTTHPVGQKQANGYGLYDMSGNVWQWMQNEYGVGRALRGGSWSISPQLVRAAFRLGSGPSGRGSHVGFRLARTLP